MTSIAHHSPKRVAGHRAPATKPSCMPPAHLPLGILSVSPSGEDHTALRQSCSGMPCWIQTAESCHTAFQRLNRSPISIVVCERDLPDGTWRDILEHLGASPERPFLIVTSPVADEWLWAEVLNLGGYDVLAKPFNAVETKYVIETACLGKRHTKRALQALAVR